MHERKFNEFKELNWRRRLHPAESAELEAFLASHPEAARQWRTEDALSRALEQLTPAPVSSNFTARVLAAAQRQALAQAPDPDAEAPWLFRSWWPRLAAGAFMMGLGFFSSQEYLRAHSGRAGAGAVQAVAANQLADLPPVDWLNNFDTIQRLDKVRVADDELLSALQ